MKRAVPPVLIVLTVLAALAAPSPASAAPLLNVQLRPFAVCADFPNQAAAQAAANTRDADGDGVYCESLPCPCAKPGSGGESESGPGGPEPSEPGSSGGTPAPATGSGSGGGAGNSGSGGGSDSSASAGDSDSSWWGGGSSCTNTKRIVNLRLSRKKYPTIYQHFRQAVKDGWPQILAINRPGAGKRSDKLLRDVEPLGGHDRNQYPPAIGRGKYRKALMQGWRPRGWRASVMQVPSREMHLHGSAMRSKLRKYCDGTRFRFRFGK